MQADPTLAKWLAAINAHDVNSLTALMATGFLFVDSLGNRLQGAKTMEAGWQAYFAMCADYRIHTELVIGEGDTWLIAGDAAGTIDGQPWSTPAAWKVVVCNGQIAEWRVFADNKPVYEILRCRVS